MQQYLYVHSHLSCAGQPSSDAIKQLYEQGFELIINLGLSDQSYSLLQEAKIVTDLGIKYFHIPVLFDNPLLIDLSNFFKIMEENITCKCLVHCAANKRASCFVALWLFKNGELREKNIETFIHQIWQPNVVWINFIEEARLSFK